MPVTTTLLTDRLDAALESAIVRERIVGAHVLVAQGGETVYRRALGWADREAARPLGDAPIFRMASVSKLYVATAALALASAGRLDLDAPVETWLPEFRTLGPDGEPAQITARHLLTHTAGLGYGFLEPADGPYHRAGVSDGADRTGLTLDENLRRIASVPLLFEPGTAWRYSLAIDVLGGLVARIAGMSLPEAVRRLVTEPLGLADTGFSVSDPARLATAYADDEGRPRRMREPDVVGAFGELAGLAIDPSRAFDPQAFPSGGAGMIGSAPDTLRLLEALRTGGAPLMAAEWTAEMTRPQTGDLPIFGWPGWSYGLGFGVLQDPALAGTPQSAGTWQWGGAYGHSWFVDPARELSVVAFTNTALEGMAGGGQFPMDVVRAVYGE